MFSKFTERSIQKIEGEEKRTRCKMLELIYCQECYKNSALFAQFLLTSLTYVLLSYFIRLHCANVHTPLCFFLSLMTSRTSRQGIHIYSVLENTYRTTRLQVLIILILWTWICTLFPQTRSLCSVWGFNSVQTS